MARNQRNYFVLPVIGTLEMSRFLFSAGLMSDFRGIITNLTFVAPPLPPR